MSLIPCKLDCIYREDGYCQLNTPAIVSSVDGSGCIHRIQKNAAENTSAAENSYQSVIQAPQSLL